MTRYRHTQPEIASRCTAGLSSGDFCDADAAPDMPFAICARHALQVYRHMQAIVTEARTNPRSYVAAHDTLIKRVHDERYARDNTPTHLVYYVEVGQLIKIGTTGGPLRQRLAAYPPGSKLLAFEQGGRALEAQRHREFSHLLTERNEWFRPAPELMAHIQRLRKAA